MFALIITTPDPSGLRESLPEGSAFRLAYQDELQRTFAKAPAALDAALAAVRGTRTAVGLGIARDEDTALGYARAALQRSSARTSGPARNIAVDAADPAAADALTGLLRLLSRRIADRTEAEWRVVDLLVPDVRGQFQAVAEALGISPQAVSKALIRTGWHEENEGRAAAVTWMERLDAAST